MKKQFFISAMLVTSLSSFADESSWGYGKDNGPSVWGELYSEYSLCSSGKNQSPIDIHDALKTHHEGLKISFKPEKQKIINNGHTIQVNVEGKNTLQLDNDTFKLQQFHFHSPSENTINGRQFPLEGHFVFENSKGELTVLAVMFVEGEANAALERAWRNMPFRKGEQAELKDLVDIKALLPNSLEFYRFSGSLTTPPCTEGVRWIVMHNTVNVSAAQIAKFHKAMPHDNNRDVQPLNGRIIIE